MKPKAEKQTPRREETAGKGNPDLIGESPHSTPGQAEGDRATVEESLRQHQYSEPQADGNSTEQETS